MAEMPPGRSAEASALLGGHHTKIDRIRKWLSGWRNAPGVPFGLKARIDSGQSMVMVDSVPFKAGCKTQPVSSRVRLRFMDPAAGLSKRRTANTADSDAAPPGYGKDKPIGV